jgi:NhaP-type Na+/H+ or K+/H+ antiporter
MTLLQIASLLLVLTAAFGAMNYLLRKLTSTISVYALTATVGPGVLRAAKPPKSLESKIAEERWKPVIMICTYMVVLFSITLQGLTIAPLAKRLLR